MKPTLARVALLALWLGVAGFGGGYAVMQRVRTAIVDDRGWLSDEEFIETIAMATALPGTAGTHVLTMVGLRFAGLRGAVVAASFFLLPSFVLMIAFGATYDRLRHLHALATFLDGMGYATVGVVGAVAVDIGCGALTRWIDWVFAVVAFVLLVFHVLGLFIVVLAAATLGALLLRPPSPEPSRPSFGPQSMRSVLFFAWPLGASATLTLFVVFAKIGLATFGGGFAMVPAIEREAVHDYRWLDEAAFNDAMVLGQVTPGPVAIAATFIGYRVSGVVGAFVATLAMFGPPFVLAVLAGRSAHVFRERPLVRGALRAIAPSVVGIIAASAVALWRTTVHVSAAGIIAVAACFVLVARRTMSPLVPLGLGGIVTLACRI